MTGFRPPERLTVSEWADKNRKLSAESSAEPGQWVTKRAEYQRGMMDALNDPDVEFVTLMTSSQVGKTEIVNNIIGYYIEHDPSPMLLIMPTLEMGMAWSKDRFAPMLRDTPSLRGRVTDARAKESGNTILHKTFQGGHITIAGANSPASLASRPVRIVLFDEADRFPPSAGTEGDPVKLGTKRTLTFWNRKVIHTSTPTVRGVSRIEALWDESDQRYYLVPCPQCGVFQRLIWAQIKWEKDKLDTVHYECQYCQAKLNEFYKMRMIEEGHWEATCPERIKHAGFAINELYSPWSTWRNVVEAFLEAKKRPETLKVWINTTLGETWEDEESYSISNERLATRVEDYEIVPKGVYLLTAGIDVQDDRLEVVVKGWGVEDESWYVDHTTIPGSPAQKDTWKMLDNYLTRTWEHEEGVPLRIASACIDSAGHFTQNVYEYAKVRHHRRIYAIKGMAGTGRPLVGKPSTSNRLRVLLFMVGVDTAKELIFARLGIEEPGPGYMHFGNKCDEEYFQQLTAEKQVTKFSKGFPAKVWVKHRARNEALDCEVYALAAFTILRVNMGSVRKHYQEKVAMRKNEMEGGHQEENVQQRSLKNVRRRPRSNFATSWMNDDWEMGRMW
jgi:phage terminase large subunit GpA-like protein